MYAKAKVTRNYQVTIPLEIRELLGVKEGSYIRFVVDEKTGKVYIEKMVEERKRIKLGRRLGVEEIDQIIEKGLRECMK